MIEDINKNISVWRGDTTPPTDYHLWETSDGKFKTKINDEWKQITSPTDKQHIDRSIYNISTDIWDKDNISFEINHNDGKTNYISLNSVSKECAGLMSSDQLNTLDNSVQELNIGLSTTTVNIGIVKNDNHIEVSTKQIPYTNYEYAGVMTAEDKSKLDTNIYNLGVFNTTREGEQAAAQPEISGNNEIALIQYKYGEKSALIIQQVGDFRTLQTIFLDGKPSARYIIFTDNNRNEVQSISRWQKCGITNLEYNDNNHKLNVKFLLDTFDDAGVVLPTAGNYNWGLIDKITYDQAVDLYTKLHNITLKSVTPTSSNILKSYQLLDSDNHVLGDTINIPKDSSIKTVEVADTKATIDSNGNIVHGQGDTALSIVYILSDGTYKIVNLSLIKFLEESEFGDGLEVNEHKVSVKINDDSSDYLSRSENGLSISTVIESLNNKLNNSGDNKYLGKLIISSSHDTVNNITIGSGLITAGLDSQKHIQLSSSNIVSIDGDIQDKFCTETIIDKKDKELKQEILNLLIAK